MKSNGIKNLNQSYGVSKTTYKSNKITPINKQGRQGVGYAGTGWVFNSVPMMKAVEKKCKGCQMNSTD